MKKLSLFIGSVSLAAVNLFGSPALYSPEQWGNAPSIEGWGYFQDSGAAASTPLSTSGGSLLINLGTDIGGGAVIGSVYADVGSTSGRFVGDLLSGGPQLNVNFKLKNLGAESSNFSSLNLYFTTGTGHLWVHEDYQSSILNSPVDYTFNIGNRNSSFWHAQGDYVFSTDFLDVATLGLQLTGASGGSRQYELYDFQFTVPEPETVWMILMVLGSLAVVFRSRMGEMLAQLRARVRI